MLTDVGWARFADASRVSRGADNETSSLSSAAVWTLSGEATPGRDADELHYDSA
jgi:hypothetical protein